MGLLNDIYQTTKISQSAYKFLLKLDIENADDNKKIDLFKEYLNFILNKVKKSNMSEEMKNTFLEGVTESILKKMGENFSKDDFLNFFGKEWEKYLK